MYSKELAYSIGRNDFSDCSATVVGYGNMGKQYVRSLQALGVRRIRVVSRSELALEECPRVHGIETISGGFYRLDCTPLPGELAIIATPPDLLVECARYTAQMGFKNILIEKPVSLWSSEIFELTEEFRSQGIRALGAYNRLCYPSFYEIKCATDAEGGITSCTYSVTEMIRDDWLDRFPIQELQRWGVSNTLHVVSMAHGLIGYPEFCEHRQAGALRWHPSGSIFVGSGISDKGIPFSYQGDWGSKGRWSIELHTAISSYRLCPLEGVLKKSDSLSDWQEVEVHSYDPSIKVGFIEQIAYSFGVLDTASLFLPDMLQVAQLTLLGENMFGYDSTNHDLM